MELKKWIFENFLYMNYTFTAKKNIYYILQKILNYCLEVNKYQFLQLCLKAKN